ncbi:MAG: chloride channel protein [Thiohalobacterales bacterium]|nr:chloride channel protein [Thiohalobacterales bacterium]
MLQRLWHQWIDKLGVGVSGIDALPQLAMLAIPVGLLSGGVIILLRQLVESGAALYMPGSDGENFEALSVAMRLLLPMAGGLLIGLVWQYIDAETRQVGIVHIMERLAYHQGDLPLRNSIAQFFGISVCILCGHSVGREGPGAHLGATSGSLLSGWLHLPNNSRRTLAACGIAAAIAASFNTPLAGVVFSMEVVMMEYTVLSFAPVILAAVIATTLTQAVFGGAPVFSVPGTQLGSLFELPIILATGLLLGCLAALFIHLLQHSTQRTLAWPIWLRCTLGGTLVGLIAMAVPEVMGIGYDTVNHALIGQLGLAALLTITFAKILATALGIGLGLPGGLIGPTLVIGAAAGGAVGIAADTWLPGDIAAPAFYAMIGMGTVMGATLHAPLAALTAMLELTANPHIILPGMLALIGAVLVSREIFKKESVFLVLMKTRGLDYQDNPVWQMLQRVGVASVMDRRLETLPIVADRQNIARALEKEPNWILLTGESGPVSVMPAADLARNIKTVEHDDPLDLKEIPATRQDVVAIDFQATLQEALDSLERNDAEALYVTRRTIPGLSRIYGIVTRSDIDRHYTI